MSVQWIIVTVVTSVVLPLHCSGMVGSETSTSLDVGLNAVLEPVKAALDTNETFPPVKWLPTEDTFESRMRKKKYKKQEIMMLTKMLMGLKIALLGVVLPLGVIVAKALSWKAVTLSLLAFMLAKIVFVKNLFMGKNAATPIAPPTPPAAPIIIHSSAPPSDALWKRQSHPRIHLQPEVHVHQGEDHHPTPSWTWAEEARAAADPHNLAYGAWLPKTA